MTNEQQIRHGINQFLNWCKHERCVELRLYGGDSGWEPLPDGRTVYLNDFFRYYSPPAQAKPEVDHDIPL